MGKSAALVLVLLFLTASCVTTPLLAKAEHRTIMVPDDYPTISAAIANAADGDTVFVKKGIYEGPQNETLFINKTISLIGEDPESTTINLHPPLVPMNIFTHEYMGYLDAIRIDANWVKLSGFTITSARAEFLISCVGSYNTITSNRVAGSGGGIYTNGSHNIIRDNSVAAESGISAGVEVNGNENILYRNNISNFVCIGSSYVPESSLNIVCGNVITNNLIIVGNSNTFNANYFQGIVMGNRIQDASNNIFYHNNFDFVENEVWFGGEKTFTVWEGVLGSIFLDNGEEGNYYSDYNGSDLNADGIGDTPYVIITKDPNNYHNIADFNIADMVLTDHYPLMTPFDISSVTMELPEWEYTPPPPSPSPSPEPTPSPSPSATPTPIPSQAPSSTPEPQRLEPSPSTLAATAAGASIALIIVGLLVHFKKRKH